MGIYPAINSIFLFIMIVLLLQQGKSYLKSASVVLSSMPLRGEGKAITRRWMTSRKDKSGDGFGEPKKPPSIFEQARMNDVLRNKMNQLQDLQNNYTNESEGSGEGRRVLEDTVDFPCNFTIKVIGDNDKSFAPDIVNAVSAETGIIPEGIQVSTRETKGGKYVSITLIAQYQNADEVYAAYKVIGQDGRVKYVI